VPSRVREQSGGSRRLWIDTSLVVLLMRVHGLWQKDKRLSIFLALLAVVSICLGVALLSVQPGVSESIWTPQIQLQPHTLDRVLSNLFNCVSVVNCWHLLIDSPLLQAPASLTFCKRARPNGACLCFCAIRQSLITVSRILLCTLPNRDRRGTYTLSY
jgi:hypothetical protein